MSSRSILRAATVCAALTVTLSTSVHAQLGGLRRAAQRATGAVQGAAPATPASAQPAPASSAVNRGDVLEMTASVLDRFQRAMEAERADLGQLEQRLSTLKTPEQFAQCQMDFYNSPTGQAVYEKLNAAAESGDYARITAAGTEAKTALEATCGDPQEGERIRRDAPAHALQAGLAAGGFNEREYAVIKERVIPFCQAAGTPAPGGEVRLPGDGSNIFWVYTAAESAALRERCATLMQGMAEVS